ISKAMQRFTVREPMRPMPTTRIDLPDRSAGRSVRRCPQLPSRTRRSYFFTRRAEASSMYIACSATDTELAIPVVISGLPEGRATQGHGVGVLQLRMKRGRLVVGQYLEVDVVALLQHVDTSLRHAA